MHLQIYDRLCLGDVTTLEFSPSIDLSGFNSLELDVVTFDTSVSGVRVVTVSMESSNDGQHWEYLTGSGFFITAVGYQAGTTATPVFASKARIKLELYNPSYTALVSVGVNITNQ
ncbi:MAG: hypothetical protein IPK67_02880 [Planctomycetes bacterium]|nr:hypothetical protein [Planctomycetota bacterium]